MYRLVFLALLPIILFAETTTIQWFRIHFPPSMIYQPEDASDATGYSDKPRTYVIQQLPEYRHVDLTVSITKAIQMAKEDTDQTICFSGFNRNEEREAFLLYSEPHLLSYPNQLIVRADNEKVETLVNPEGRISLEQFLEAGMTVSIAKNRSFSPRIDPIITDYGKDNLITPLSDDISRPYLKQVIYRRADATIDYPVNINYYAKEKTLNSSWLQTYPIEEDYGMTKVYFACSKASEKSEEIIKKINTIIESNQTRFTDYYFEWLDEKQKARYPAL